MNDNRKIIVRKAKDGINHEAVIMDYCGRWFERRRGSGYTEMDALIDLRQSMITDILFLERDLDFLWSGKINYE